MRAALSATAMLTGPLRGDVSRALLDGGDADLPGLELVVGHEEHGHEGRIPDEGAQEPTSQPAGLESEDVGIREKSESAGKRIASDKITRPSAPLLRLLRLPSPHSKVRLPQ